MTYMEVCRQKWQNHVYMHHQGKPNCAGHALDVWWDYCEKFLSETQPNWGALSPETVAYRNKFVQLDK